MAATANKEQYRTARKEEKEFTELFWEWRSECKRKFGIAFVRLHAYRFNKKAFRVLLTQYDNIEAANEAAPIYIPPMDEQDRGPTISDAHLGGTTDPYATTVGDD